MSTTKGTGVDVTFECAGDEATLNQAFTLTRPGGRISLIGHHRQTPRFNIEHLIIKSLNVYGPVGGHSFFGEAVDLILERRADLAQMVSHTFPIEQAREAFAAASDVNESVKVLFAP